MLAVLISKKPPVKLLSKDLAQFLGVPKVKLWDCDNEESPSSETWFWYWDKKGDFVALLEIYGGQLEHISNADLAELLSQKYGCKCLISDNSVNPYSSIEINGEMRRIVYLSDTHDTDEIILTKR